MEIFKGAVLHCTVSQASVMLSLKSFPSTKNVERKGHNVPIYEFHFSIFKEKKGWVGVF